MEDISNKTLATLLIAAIVISLGGTIVSLNKLGEPRFVQVTGKATSNDAGTATVSVDESTAISLTTASIDFGTGYVDASDTNCDSGSDVIQLCTEGAGTNLNDCFISAPATPVSIDGNGFVLENVGTTNVTVYVKGESNLTFYGGIADDEDLYQFRWKANDDSESGSCATDGTLQDSEYVEFSENATICDKFRWETANDELEIDVRLQMKYNVVSAEYSDSAINFQAYKST